MITTTSDLVAELFDYAGAFPPASLASDAAWKQYLKLRESALSPIVGRFVAGVGHLGSLAPLAERSPQEITVVCKPGSEDWGDVLEAAAQQMTQFDEAMTTEGSEIVAFEVALPDYEDLKGRLDDAEQFASVEVYVELPWGDGQMEALAAIAERDSLLAKARTGGAYVPSALELASWLSATAQLEIPFKLTAGLHNALRGKDHGFMNVLLGLALTLEHELSTAELAAILDETSQAAFQGETYRGMSLSAEAVEDARGLLVSIGSCDLEDSWTDLKGWGR